MKNNNDNEKKNAEIETRKELIKKSLNKVLSENKELLDRLAKEQD